MSKHSKEVKEKAIYLSEKDGVAFRIAKELEIPESTVKTGYTNLNLVII